MLKRISSKVNFKQFFNVIRQGHIETNNSPKKKKKRRIEQVENLLSKLKRKMEKGKGKSYES